MIKIKPGTRREQLDDKRISRNFFFFLHTFIIFEQRGKIYCHPLRFLSHFREPLARRKACKTISNIYRREDELVFFAFSFSFYPFPGFPRVNARARSFSVRFTSLFRSSLSSLSHSRLFHFLVLASLALINQLINYVLTFLAKKSH